VTSSRLASGGRLIDRSKPVKFRFDGVEYEGYEGDTLASALLANGVVSGFRSPILGRPRGIYSAGVDEPNAFVEISAPWFDPIVAATTVDLVEGLVAESRAGVGRLPRPQAPVRSRRVEHRHVHVEVLVIGAGHDGLYLAERAALRGERAIVVEQGRDLIEPSGSDWLPDGVTYLTRATALGLYDDGYVTVLERDRELDRMWHVRAGQVVLATGTRERLIAFADNDRPGITLAHAGRAYGDYGVRVGARAVVFGVESYVLGFGFLHGEAGPDVAAVLDLGNYRPASEHIAGLDVRRGWGVTGTEGTPELRAVHVRGPDGERETIECDALLVSGGRTPNLDLWRAIGGTVRYDEDRGCFVPHEGPGWLSVEGGATGKSLSPAALYPFVPAEDYSTHFVDLQRDQTVADVAAAVESGLRSVEHVKRATYIGTAIDQGRTSGVVAAEVVNALLGDPAGAQGPSNARPPTMPVSFGALAGPYRGALLDPIRLTPIHASHVERGAVFENVGQWKRPWYFPGHGESIADAVARECLAVRKDVGAMDASTLGKIEVVGPDAPAFLDRMYTNRMSNLKVGSIRYGLMCGLDGMVFDDGVAMRLAEERYLVTTTTGGAARVLDHFEEWLQTEWPDLRVFCTSVTEQWAVVALNGPRARDVLAAAGTDVDLAKEAFPHMTFRDGTVAGVPARLARVSFSGELGFEVHVSSRHGREVWEALMASGEAFDIVPYGTEAMHVLRAEKGYVIVGQDTDGTVTPFDLGMDWIVNPSKGDFIGRRSFSRPDTARPDRKQLVGLLPQDPEALLPEGIQLVLQDTGRIPMPMAGHVTSSYRSAALGRTFALAMVQGGHAMHGRTVFAPLPERTITATVTPPVFYDSEGVRRDG
jgi:sarcosine oxidase subunit alpha